ncbi:hypothetical protein QO016_004386 [Methylobacterium persicinum]|jgi:hypothetical protein|uniref:Uncharacterized protein n=1 Tax=Methylobacterium persicinum TaxID=374426 RepID=A0ABU0HRA3_9HYPH|nr:hypothetical protein [Methylobacterium persicinum]GJE36051.1 hypothetical protein KHHGKMAE_0097 [Methylobacterium persicinum]
MTSGPMFLRISTPQDDAVSESVETEIFVIEQRILRAVRPRRTSASVQTPEQRETIARLAIEGGSTFVGRLENAPRGRRSQR